jgi:hypothetical protein
MSWTITGVGVPFDNDAWEYIARVETADGQILEQSVRNAITNFVLGCKADGIWDAIKASCILAGARTRLGALTPLVGTAPTSFNFVDGDYNRKTGLVGDGSTKYLDSNRNNNADPQNSKHLSVFVSTSATRDSNRGLIGAGITGTGSSGIVSAFSNNRLVFRVNSQITTDGGETSVPETAPSFVGCSRSTSSSGSIRFNQTTAAFSNNSESLLNQNIVIFGRNLTAQADARLAFYSIGESLNLALLDARVTDLINALSAAIP